MKPICCLLIVLAACTAPKQASIEDLVAHQELSAFKLGTLRGTRDGDRLDAQALFTDSSSILTIQMRFVIGMPTKLESGTWNWTRSGQLTTGTVAAKSVDFLGGQSGPPSIGGSYLLLGPDSSAMYRVFFPITELKERLK